MGLFQECKVGVQWRGQQGVENAERQAPPLPSCMFEVRLQCWQFFTMQWTRLTCQNSLTGWYVLQEEKCHVWVNVETEGYAGQTYLVPWFFKSPVLLLFTWPDSWHMSPPLLTVGLWTILTKIHWAAFSAIRKTVHCSVKKVDTKMTPPTYLSCYRIPCI